MFILRDNSLETYIRERIRELIYEESDFDEQYATLITVANKYNTIMEELQQTKMAIENQCQGEVFDEVVRYIDNIINKIKSFIAAVDELTVHNVVIR